MEQLLAGRAIVLVNNGCVGKLVKAGVNKTFSSDQADCWFKSSHIPHYINMGSFIGFDCIYENNNFTRVITFDTGDN